MALIQCKGCGHQISTLAKACPHCGTPLYITLSQPSGATPKHQPQQQRPYIKKIYTEQPPAPAPVEKPQDAEVYDGDELNQEVDYNKSSSKGIVITLIVLATVIGLGAWFFFSDPMGLFKNKKDDKSSSAEESTQNESHTRVAYPDAVSYEEESLPPINETSNTAAQAPKQESKTNSSKAEEKPETQQTPAREPVNTQPAAQPAQPAAQPAQTAAPKANSQQPKKQQAPDDYDESEAEKELKAIQGIENSALKQPADPVSSNRNGSVPPPRPKSMPIETP